MEKIQIKIWCPECESRHILTITDMDVSLLLVRLGDFKRCSLCGALMEVEPVWVESFIAYQGTW
jgi:hypothetical protein